MCPESQFIKTLISHLILKKGEHLVMDMEAGLEHFGRGTAQECDFVLVVVEPSMNSLGTARKIAQVAKDIGIKRVYAIGNKIRDEKDSTFLKKELKGIKLVSMIDFDDAFLQSDKEKVLELPQALYKTLEELKTKLEGELTS